MQIKPILFSRLPYIWSLVILLVVSITISSCVNSENITSEEKPFRIASFPPPRDLHPLSGLQDVALYQIYRHLLWYKWSNNGIATRQPYLLESYKISQNEKECLLRLRQNVYFHNGEEMTAEDVVYTLKRLENSVVKLNDMSIATSLQIEPIDRYSLRLRSEEPIEWKSVMLIPILNAKYERKWENKNLDDYRPMGTGPYRFVKYDRKSKVTSLERFERFWLGASSIPKLEIHYYDEPEGATMALLENKADYVMNLSPENAQYISTHPDLHMFKATQPASLQIFLNTRTPNLSDSRIRRALSLLVDRNAIANDRLILNGEADASDAPLHFAHPITKPTAEAINTDEGMKLFEEAGWVRKQGKMLKDGKQFKLTILISRHNSHYEQVIRKVIVDWSKAGILSIPQYMDFDNWLELWTTGEFEAAFSEIHDIHDLSMNAKVFVSNGEMNYGGFSDPKVDSLFKKLKPNTNPQLPVKQSIQQKLITEAPMITLAYPASLGAVRKAYMGYGVKKDPNVLYYLGFPR